MSNYNSTRVLALTSIGMLDEEKYKPTLHLFTVDFQTEKIEEVWRAEGVNPSRRFPIQRPIIADVDDDGQNELLAVDPQNLYLWKVPEQKPIIKEVVGGNPWVTTLTTADANKDGKQEIFVARGNILNVFHYDKGEFHAIVNPIEVPFTTFINNIRIGDADNDGSLEILVGGRNDSPSGGILENNQKIITVYTLSKDNKLIEKGRINSPVQINCSIRIADANNDGKNEVIVSGMNTLSELSQNKQGQGLFIWQYNSHTGLYEMTNENRNVGNGPESMNVGDVNNDGLNEIVVANLGSYDRRLKPGQEGFEEAQIHVLQLKPNNDFKTLWKGSHNVLAHYEGISIGDLDKDGLNEFSLMGIETFKFDSKTETYKSIKNPVKSAMYSTIGDVYLKNEKIN